MEAKTRFLLLNPRQIGAGIELEWEVDGGGIRGQVRHDCKVTPLAEVRSVCVQRLSRPRTKGATNKNPPATVSEAAAHWLVHNFLETIPVLVCNRPSAMATNFSKTWQQQIIAAHGFRVPRTLTTNVLEEARRFYDAGLHVLPAIHRPAHRRCLGGFVGGAELVGRAILS